MEITYDGQPIEARAGDVLGQVLRDAGIALQMPCGGAGKCGKCKVYVSGQVPPITDEERTLLTAGEIERGVRLACRVKLLGEAQVRTYAPISDILVDTGAETAIETEPSSGVGLAVDIGTTTVAAAAYDLMTGRRLGACGARNPQYPWGADVVSRIDNACKGHLGAMAQAVREIIAQLARRLCQDTGEIKRAVIVGNTTMMYLLTGSDPSCLGAAPFIPDRLFGETVDAGELGLGFDCGALLVRCPAAFVGADTTAALLAAGLQEGDVLMDIGTNGEIACLFDGRLTACSTAAGPVFEGAGISSGMQASQGAIYSVKAVDGAVECSTIGGGPAQGVCGSGFISAAAALLDMGVIDESGAMEEPFALSEGVSLTQGDIRQLQLAKSAIRSGLDTLLRQKGAGEERGRLYIAGGFGSSMDTAAAERIGLIPAGWGKKTRFLGNAAIVGAAMMLLSPRRAQYAGAMAQDIHVIELSNDPFFGERFIENMMFE